MDKKLIVGGLAVVGALALFAYLKPKSKLNSEGFFGANGRTTNKMGWQNCYDFYGNILGGVPLGQKCPKGTTPVLIPRAGDF